MRIAQVAPLYERVPPLCYGGTERIVSYLTEELIRQGHQLTLFASGESLTDGSLVASCDRSLRLNPDCLDYMAYHFLQLNKYFPLANSFDVFHFNTDYLHFLLYRRHAIPN